MQLMREIPAVKTKMVVLKLIVSEIFSVQMYQLRELVQCVVHVQLDLLEME